MAEQKTLNSNPTVPNNPNNPNNISYLIDIGVNLTNSQFAGNDKHKPNLTSIKKVLDIAFESNLEAIINIGTTMSNSRQGIELVQHFQSHPLKLYTTVGLHPHSARFRADLRLMKELITSSDRIVAIGECGLDYNRLFSQKEDQLLAFREQIQLANRIQNHELPLYLHERDAFEDFVKEMKSFQGHKAVVHCFTGTAKEAEYYVNQGYFIGVTGFIGNRNRSQELDEALKTVVPLERVMLETDAPYMAAGSTQRWRKPSLYGRNVSFPEDVFDVARILSKIYNVSVSDVVQRTSATTKEFFNL